MRAFSMFSGIGGFDLACKRHGIDILGACEIDQHARRIYSRHFPGVRIWEDATKLSPPRLPEFDLLLAGFPCQTFSVAGKRLGFEESRGTLFFEIARIAREKRPRLLLLENVKGLLSHDNGKTFAVILSVLDELGYDAEWQVLNSKYFVPQNRERIFIIGYLRGESRPEVFPIGEVHQVPAGKQEPPIARCLTAGEKANGLHSQMTMIKEPDLVQIGNVDQKGHNSIWGRIYDPKGIAPTINSEGGGLGAKTGLIAVVNDNGKLRKMDLCGNLRPNYHKGMDNHGQRTMVYLSQKNANMKQRTQNRSESWTLTAANNDFAIQEGSRIRKLTPLECERLQGFPDGWTEGISDTQRYRCLGNAVTVPVVEFILDKLMSTL